MEANRVPVVHHKRDAGIMCPLNPQILVGLKQQPGVQAAYCTDEAASGLSAIRNEKVRDASSDCRVPIADESGLSRVKLVMVRSPLHWCR